MANSFIYTINKSQLISDFSIDGIYHVKDKNEKNVSIFDLRYNTNKLFLIETPFLKVLKVNENEIQLELNDISKNELTEIDDKIFLMLENIINLQECRTQLYDSLDNLNYLSIIKNDNYIKIYTDKNTKILSNNKNNNIQVNDIIQICFLIESINIYPELNLAGLKTSCKFINIQKEYKPIDLDLDFNFTNDTSIEKPILLNQDLSQLNTVVERINENSLNIKSDINIVETIIEKKKKGRKPKIK